jgi:hypothetical protein
VGGSSSVWTRRPQSAPDWQAWVRAASTDGSPVHRRKPSPSKASRDGAPLPARSVVGAPSLSRDHAAEGASFTAEAAARVSSSGHWCSFAPPGPLYPLDVGLLAHDTPPTGCAGRGATSASGPSFRGRRESGRAPRTRPEATTVRSLLSRGISTLPGGRGSGLPFDGASFEHESKRSATVACLALPGRLVSSRSSRSHVRPPRPERHARASSSAAAAPRHSLIGRPEARRV